ncbi:hypothetical protein F5Y19DRAFT_492314 [Xylariaceae sp. FL1651]|nr:hypothetical protein F5Y19DRAFT_492314 [Xylariaceae sp. FL1651]
MSFSLGYAWLLSKFPSFRLYIFTLFGLVFCSHVVLSWEAFKRMRRRNPSQPILQLTRPQKNGVLRWVDGFGRILMIIGFTCTIISLSLTMYKKKSLDNVPFSLWYLSLMAEELLGISNETERPSRPSSPEPEASPREKDAIVQVDREEAEDDQLGNGEIAALFHESKSRTFAAWRPDEFNTVNFRKLHGPRPRHSSLDPRKMTYDCKKRVVSIIFVSRTDEALTDEAFAGVVANRAVQMSTTVIAEVELLEYAVETFHAAYSKLKGLGNLLYSITFEPIPPSDGPLVVILLYSSWDKSSDDETIYEANQDALRAVEAKARETNSLSPYLYLNYAFPRHQNAIGSYGPDSTAQLQAASKKYDPEGFFQKAGMGLWKLPL